MKRTKNTFKTEVVKGELKFSHVAGNDVIAEEALPYKGDYELRGIVQLDNGKKLSFWISSGTTGADWVLTD